MLGALLAALVVLLFLGNLRSTLIAGDRHPGLDHRHLRADVRAGFTLNTITLLALALAVGIVIDDAIVVLENIHRFIEEKGMKPFPAAILATQRDRPRGARHHPVADRGVPAGRLHGRHRRAASSKSFGLTMAFAIAVSLFVSFTLTPMLSARWLKPLRARRFGPGEPARAEPLLERMVDACYSRSSALYMRAARLGDAPPLGGGGRVACAALAVDRAAHARRSARASCRRATRRSSRSTCALPRAPASRRPSVVAERIAREVRGVAERQGHAGHHRRQRRSGRPTSPTST